MDSQKESIPFPLLDDILRSKKSYKHAERADGGYKLERIGVCRIGVRGRMVENPSEKTERVV